MEEEYNSPQESRMGSREASRSESTGSPMMIDLSARSGGRPTGSSRRAIRMQAEWDAEQTARLKEEQMAMQMEKEMRAQKTEDLKYSILENNFEAQQKNESLQTKLQADLSSQRDNVFSALDNLDPRSSDFVDQIADIRLKNSLAFSDQNVVGVVEQFLKVNSIYMGAQKEQQQKQEGLQEKQDQRLTELTKLASQTDRNLSDLAQMDSETGELIIDHVAVGEAEAELDIVTENRRAEAVVQAAENRDIIARQKELDKDIRRENQRLIEFRSQRESKARDRDIETSKNKILDLRIEKAELQGLVFDSEEEAEKAEPPSGSIIYIGRKPHKVP
jgi:uncharacterized lipoprotein YmbA